MAAVSSPAHRSPLPLPPPPSPAPDELSPSSRDADDDKHPSCFTIHNVLKKERDHSPDVFSTDKLLKHTPNVESPRDSQSPVTSIENDDTNPGSLSAINVDDEVSCCSDDTVLSVGNEAPPAFQEASRSPPSHNLTSFKHIQTHLNAISQLSQNLSLAQPLLLRPSPVAPSLMFLNQSMLFQNQILNPEMKISRPVPHFPKQDYRRLELMTQNEESRLNQNLKFSIDNILKADFGRRITDPIKRKSKPRVEIPKTLVKDATVSKVDVESRIPGPEKEKVDPKTDDGGSSGSASGDGPMVWPAWVYCTRYSDRPSSGPRTRRPKKPPGETAPDEKRPRTAFSGPQLARLKHEFAENRYLTERRRQALAAELGLAEAQIKIWFQNKRAKIKKASGQRNPLALQLMAQGLYNHSTVPLTKEEEELEMKAREREQARV